jgi:hypothetical protein
MRLNVKIIIFLVLAFCQVHLTFSQNGRDKVELLRVSFINKQLELTTAEAEKFWPVYNEYNDKIKAIRKNLRISFRKANDVISEAEAEELYQLDLKSKQAELDVHKIYSEKIRTIIGVKKSVRLKIAEEEFKQEIIKSIKEKSD